MKYRMDAEYWEMAVTPFRLLGIQTQTMEESRQHYAEDSDPTNRCAACHEAGHALKAIRERVQFDYAVVHPPPRGGGEIVYDQLSFGYMKTVSRLDSRLAIALSGALAEEQEFGSVDPLGAEKDIRGAFARVGILDPSASCSSMKDVPPDLVVALSRARHTLRVDRDSLDRISQALAQRGRLSRRECAELVTDAHSPLYSSLDPEHDRVRQAHALIKAAQDARRPAA